MPPDEPDRLRELVTLTLEQTQDERTAFLADACGDNEALRAEVLSLVGREQAARAFLEAPAVRVNDPSTRAVRHGELKPDDRLGDCRILSLLGEGGMGEVYLAEDTKLERRVAIKLLKRQLGDDARGRQFQHERRVLAGLTHPGIARLYGAALSPEGRSYLVMEYVEGERLDRYCDARGLGIPERLALFRKVCAAVAYAHQNLVVHRDLKPANIWVTAEGEPKLLDFGIAKLLDADAGEDGDATPTVSGAMTPEYASPEQLRGEAITTASDVYSLGVILCELLTGQRPYRLKSRRPAEIAAAICTEELRRPSTLIGGTDANGGAKPLPAGQSADRLRRRLRGDLDNIVALALRKEPTRRYTSVGQFSEDLRRHGEGLPVLARPDTLAYRTSKFVRRNKVGVAAAALVALALVAGMITTTWEARRADRRFNDVRQLAHAMLFEIEPQIASLAGATPARSALVKHALAYLDSLSREAGENRELRRELATAYEKVGEVQGNPTTSNLGDLSGALSSYRKAGELRRSLVQADPRDARARHELATNFENIGSVLWWSNQTDDALANYAQALRLRRALLAEQPASAEFRRGFASLQMSIGEVADWNGRPAEALEDYRQALAVEQGLAQEHPDDVEAQINVVRCLSRIGGAQKNAGQYDAGAETLATGGGPHLRHRAAPPRQQLRQGRAVVRVLQPM